MKTRMVKEPYLVCCAHPTLRRLLLPLAESLVVQRVHELSSSGPRGLADASEYLNRLALEACRLHPRKDRTDPVARVNSERQLTS